MDCFDRLVSAARELKTDVRVVKKLPWSIQRQRNWFYASPFDSYTGIQVDDTGQVAVVLVEGPGVLDCVGPIIHELGHICVTGGVTIGKEFDFFGWEFVLAQKCGFVEEWLASNYGYQVDEYGMEFDKLTDDEQSEFLEERIYFAVKNGFVVNDEPIRVATKWMEKQ